MNVLNRINLILAAMGSKPYSIKKLSLDDLINLSDYSLGIKNLVENLVEAEEDGITYFYIDKRNRLNNFLYRASSDKNMEAFLFTPGERISQGTSNVYNRLISNILPSWRGIPKRNKSIIGTNDHYVASNYQNYGERVGGKIYIVIPPNDAMLAVAAADDLWRSFAYLSSRTGLENMSDVNKSILSFLSFFYNFITDSELLNKTISMSINTDELLKHIETNESLNINKLKDIFAKQSKSVIVSIFNGIDQLLIDKKFLITILPVYSKYLDDCQYPEIGSYIIKIKVSNNNMTILKILDDLFNPKKNGFKFVIYTTFVSKTYPSCEVWTDRPCIFIDSSDNKFLTQLYYRYSALNKEEIQ